MQLILDDADRGTRAFCNPFAHPKSEGLHPQLSPAMVLFISSSILPIIPSLRVHHPLTRLPHSHLRLPILTTPKMVSAFSVEVKLSIPADVLWRVRASKQFMSFLVSQGALNRMDASLPRTLPASRTAYSRVQTYVPAEVSIPDMIKPIIDDSYIEITDTQTWDDVEKPLEQTFQIQPSFLPNLVKSNGRLSVKPLESDLANNEADGSSCLHTVSGECSVSVPLIGWYAEQAIIDNMRNFYDSYPDHVSNFVNMVVNRWGNGSVDSLRAAVCNMLAEEKTQE